MVDLPVYKMAGGGVGFCLLMCLLLFWARRMERRARLQAGQQEDGRVMGIVGLPGGGKTSFIVGHYAVPALRQGRTVITNFQMFVEDLPGRWVKMRPSTFGEDLLGIGSSLNIDEETGEPMSGWFVDTACTCGKDHDETCSRPDGDVPAKACCKGFRARRLCNCNGVVLVTDEVQSFVPANQSKPLPLDLLTWATMIRKNHVFWIWSTQYWKWVHSAVRRLTRQGLICETDVLYSDRVARMYDVDYDKGEMSGEPLTTVRYKPAVIAGNFYDSAEVIVPSSTAADMLGQMSRRHLRVIPGGGGAERHAAGST